MRHDTSRAAGRPSPSRSMRPTSKSPTAAETRDFFSSLLALKLAQAMFPALGRARSAYDLQIAVLPSVVRMELRGIGFNRAAHEELLAQLRAEWARLEEAYVAACDVIGRPDLKRKIPTTPIAKQKLLRA